MIAFKLKRKIRRFALWLKYRTDRWVVPKEIYNAIDRDETVDYKIFDQLRDQWPYDPEITYAETLLTLLDSTRPDE